MDLGRNSATKMITMVETMVSSATDPPSARSAHPAQAATRRNAADMKSE